MTHHKQHDFNVNEYCSWILSQGASHNCIIVAGVKGGVVLNKLQEAVKAASLEQSMLGFSIANEYCGFVPTDHQIQVQYISDMVNWLKVAEGELAKPFLDGEVLARITLIDGDGVQYIILCFHHVIGDGTSGTQFLQRIISFYNHPSSIIITGRAPINAPIPSEKKVFRAAFHPKCTTKIANIFLDLEKMQFVEAGAIRLGCSLNAYLSANLLKAALEVFGVSHFNISMAVDLRREVDTQSFYPLKFLTSWIDFKSDGLSGHFIEGLQSNVRRCLKAKQHLNNLNALNQKINYRNDDVSFAQDFISRRSSVCITNSGMIDDITAFSDGAIKIVEWHLSVSVQSYMGTHDSFTVQLNGLKGVGQFIKINYPDPLVSSEKVSDLLTCVQKNLLS